MFEKYSSRNQEYLCRAVLDSLLTTDFFKQFLTTEKNLAVVFGVKNAFGASFGQPGWGQNVISSNYSIVDWS